MGACSYEQGGFIGKEKPHQALDRGFLDLPIRSRWVPSWKLSRFCLRGQSTWAAKVGLPIVKCWSKNDADLRYPTGFYEEYHALQASTSISCQALFA